MRYFVNLFILEFNLSWKIGYSEVRVITKFEIKSDQTYFETFTLEERPFDFSQSSEN